ncbi:2,3-diphosphoglycerate-dependent phosphoglycerate mutase [Lactobacillus sp. DCY120]|uniref:2,3-bisphosphoglycerate-dependent phosphoglycerate mutase n=1 Tax=Bombilactobacillus apium TaxID=2675299 RepID=A0A850R648_9LACO|nr:2,3-diphosphoglycerate-dependent phosphoglycerate mutase [Bombilactobacillus apium]NVY96015.1 2,3-diphosphoglycerate-dependent phosphoglycerate mutase [Bombilactobacillus apium]
MVKLILIRHGESQANARNEYTGWSDVPLTSRGEEQARGAGKVLAQAQIEFSAVHTSVLQRAILTAYLIQEECQALDRPIYKSWRLNERHYGALRGLNKDYTRKKYGVQQVSLWRRSYRSLPPQLEQVDTHLRVYQAWPSSILPRSESLAMALQRTVPYFQDQVAPKLRQGQNQLIVVHGSTLRALIKYLEGISDSDIDGVEVANAQPLVYDLTTDLEIKAKTILTAQEK